MKTFQCYIVDDEPIAIDILVTYLQRLEVYSVKGAFTNPVKAFESLRQEPADLLFLDIQMPELTGLELLQSLRRRPEVILTTAYREYALEGFDLDVVDYLLKPISFDRFLKSLDKFQARIGTQASKVPGLLTNDEEPAHLFVRADRKNIKVYLHEILYLESLKDYVRIVTAGGKIMTKETLTHFEENLPAERFLRVHRSFLVARDKVSAFSVDGLEIGKVVIPVGRLYKLTVEKAILGDI